MLSTSFEFRTLLSQNSKVLLKATLTLADDTVVNLSGDDFMMGSAAFSEAVSSDGSFDIGAAIMGQFSVSLNNYDQRFADFDFTEATIVPYVGAELSNGGVEWLLKGHYTVEQPRSYGNTIGLTALDNMKLLEEPYSSVTTTYPATLQTIVREICTKCGIVLATSSFANDTYVVQTRPDDDALTCIDMISYAAQVSGNYAKCDTEGRLVIAWYDTAAFESEDWLDGDRFDEATPYDSGDDAEGGDFDDYSSGDSADGGDFDTTRFAIIHAISSSTIVTDDVVITGVNVTAQAQVTEDGTQGQDGETSLYGSEGYVLSIEGNPLILYGQAAAVAAQIGARVVGMRFRPFDLSAIGDPAIEAGDPAIVTDRLQNQYRTYITSLTYKVGNFESFSCAAETPSRNSATSFSALTKAIVQARNSIKREKTAREAALAELTRELAESSGLFMTEEQQQDQSIIYYMHDKPTLAESQIVWKLTANALGISTDGGTTYPYGLDVTGNAILNRIYAIGLDADYLTLGRLSDRAGYNYWDLVTGDFQMASTAGFGSKLVQDIIDVSDVSITSVDIEYAQNQSSSTPPASGWTTTAPTWQAGYYIWQRTKTVNANGTNYSDPVCISGRDGATGTNAATIYLYQRAATAPSNPSSSMTYTFSTGTLSGTLGNWSRGIPSGTDMCWVIVASAISNSDTDTIAASEWSNPVALSTGGIDGLNQATIYLHQRAKAWKLNGRGLVSPSASAFTVSGTTATIPGTVSGTTLALESEAPSKPSSTLTYTFASGALSGNVGDWTRGVPEGDDPVWVTLATAISAEATDSIAASEWTDPVKLAEDGDDSVVVDVSYAVGVSGIEPPSTGWQSSIPNVGKGFWLWAKTLYSDGSESLTCTYMGKDGNSVAIQSVSKELGITTIVLASTDGTTETLRIADGEDGPNGTPGANGYVHVAWATSADGYQGFSTTVSAGKTYIGVYTDNTEADSSNPSDYSWSLIKGADGVGIRSVEINYGVSSSDVTQPTSWQSNPPSVSQGRWLWVRTVQTLTDDSTTTAYTKSYMGTDGEDGKSVYVQSATKSNGVTTVVLTDGATSNTLSIVDGSDGQNGTPGANGYVHVAWATSADGSQGFSTSVSTGKTYIGVYTDNTQADSQTYSDYSWSLIKGADGTGVSAVEEQYYLSTSSSTQSGGSWSTAQPTWESGKYIWTRTKVTWTDGNVTYTDPVLAQAINGANQQAASASSAVTALDNSLDQSGVFNRLTNNGALQGLYMSNGSLYVNASYIKSGTLVVGGSNNVNGVIQIKDASGTVIGTLDKSGATIDGELKMTIAGYSSGRKIHADVAAYSITDPSGAINGITTAQTLRGMRVYGSGGSTQDGAIYIVSQIDPASTYSGVTMPRGCIASKGFLTLIGGLNATTKRASVSLSQDMVSIVGGTNSNHHMIWVDDASARILRDTTSYPNVEIVNFKGASTAASTTTTVNGALKCYSLATTGGTKNRLVETDNYSDRLLYCYETTSPMFGDIGSGTIGDDGYCYVEIDDIFSETARTDISYQVFLQACGAGDLWVAEKTARYFAVEGTPGLAFDWEVKCRQTGYENTRIEQDGLDEISDYEPDVASYLVEEYGNCISEIESMYADELGF